MTLLSTRYGLTPSEETVVLMLMGRRTVKATDMIEALWPDPDKEPDYAESAMKVFVHRARRKIAPHGWEIKANYKRSYTLVALNA